MHGRSIEDNVAGRAELSRRAERQKHVACSVAPRWAVWSDIKPVGGALDVLEQALLREQSSARSSVNCGCSNSWTATVVIEATDDYERNGDR